MSVAHLGDDVPPPSRLVLALEAEKRFANQWVLHVDPLAHVSPRVPRPEAVVFDPMAEIHGKHGIPSIEPLWPRIAVCGVVLTRRVN